MTAEQAKLKASMCVSDLRGVSEMALSAACKRYRQSDNRDDRFFHLGTLLRFCREEERSIALARRQCIAEVPGPLHQTLPEHPCPVPRLAGRTEEDERIMSLEQTIVSLTKTREEVPEDVVVSLDAIRAKYPPRKIGVRKQGGGA